MRKRLYYMKYSFVLLSVISLMIFGVSMESYAMCYQTTRSVKQQSVQKDNVRTKQILVTNTGKFSDALKSVKAGETILLRAGTYEGHFNFTNSGTKAAPIVISSYPGEVAKITIPKGSDGAAFSMNGCQNIQIEGLSFSNLQAEEAYGILMTGGEENIKVQGCEFAHIETTGPGTTDSAGGGANAILLLGEKENPISNITIENNHVHYNVNGWSENISVAGNCESILVRNNVVHDCTNIGIDFYGNAEYCKIPSLDQPRNCECIGNKVYNCKSFYAENSGIYVDGAYNILIEGNETCGNPYGIEIGSEEWRPYYSNEKCVHGITVKNNRIHDNEECGLRIGGYTDDAETGVVRDCTIVGNQFSENNHEIIIAKCDTIRFEKNIFASGKNCAQSVVYDDCIARDKIVHIEFR